MTTKETVAVRMNEGQITVVLTAMEGYRNRFDLEGEALEAHDRVMARMQTAFARVTKKTL